jgi:filamentous hemagglutinin family protein
MLPTRSQAQISLDGSLGMAGPLTGPHYTIPYSVGQVRGPNLFHSFGQFNLFAGESATFTGPSTIHNILGRVTGGSRSIIDGLISTSSMPGANLYLLNPSGVLFGPNASLDMSGSFHVSTADYVRFADGAVFSTHLAVSSVLTVAPLVAFGFLGPTAAPITVADSQLQVPNGATLSLIGGDIAVAPFLGIRLPVLRAPGGNIHLVSVASAGEVGINPADPTAPVQVGSFASLGRIDLTGARLDVSGSPGGTIVIRGGHLLLDSATVAADTTGDRDGARVGIDINVTQDMVATQSSTITADVHGAGRAGDVRLTADTLDLNQDTTIGARASSGTTGERGNIDITTRLMQVTGGAQVTGSTIGTGRGGTITVTVAETLTLAGGGQNGSPSAVGTSVQGYGPGSTVIVRTNRLVMRDGGLIMSNTFGAGPAGEVTVQVGTLEMSGGAINAASGTDRGEAGTITVMARDITLRGGGQLNASTAGTGRGGTVRVTAADTLTIVGQSPTRVPSGVLSNASPSASGDAGQIVISASTLTMDTGLIQAVAAAGSSGNAGGIDVRAGRMTLSGGAQMDTSTRGSGRGGTVTVTATESLMLAGSSPTGIPSGVFSDTSGSGAAGMVQVSAPQLTMQTGAAIRSDTSATGAAGMVMVRAGVLDLQGGVIRSQSNGSTGDAGVVVVEGTRLTVGAGGQISSSTFGAGRGGTVTVTATESLTLAQSSTDTPSGVFSNTSGSGAAGMVQVTAPQLTIQAGTEIGSATSATGAAGMITVRAGVLDLQGGTISSQSNPKSTGDAGAVVVEGTRLTLGAGGQISSSTFGAGRGGTVTVTATESLTLAGRSSTGIPSGVFSDTSGSGVAGTVQVDAPQLTMQTGAVIRSDTSATGAAGMVMVRAGVLDLHGSTISAGTSGTGQGGDLGVEVDRLTLTGGAQIRSDTSPSSETPGPGAGGTVTVTAHELIHIAGQNSAGVLSGLFSFAGEQGGAAGRLMVTTPTLILEDGGQINASTLGAGRAGDIRVDVGQLTLRGGALIESSTLGAGAGGTVTVTAHELIHIAGQDSTGTLSGLFSIAGEQGGAAGRLVVTAPALILEDGGQINASTAGAGQAGDIRVDVGQLMLTGGALLGSGTAGAGAGGTVTVTATDAVVISGQNSRLTASTIGAGQGGAVTLQALRVELTDGATISAKSTSGGNAGNVTITTQDSFLSTHGSVVTQATQTDGGNIQITAPHFLRLRDSTITAEVGGGAQTVGGNITIDPQFVVLQNSQIVANAFQGRGGNIHIQAQQAFLADPASLVSASSALGINGQVNIQAPVTNISGAVAPLPQAFAQPAELLRSRCAERLREGTVSRFVVGSRDGVPLEPGSLLLSPLERMGQEGGGPGEERANPNAEAQPGRAWYTQAQASGGLEVECARWRGQAGTAVPPRRLH